MMNIQVAKLKRTEKWVGALTGLWAIFLFMIGLAQAAPAPEIVKGVAWLQAQVQNDGSLLNESSSMATSLQNKAETLQTLKLLGTVPTALADALQSDAEDNTEYLARRAITLVLAGRDITPILSVLAARQNGGGGFGGAIGHVSTALDTAWTMVAFAQAGQGNSALAMAGRNFLTTAIQADGGIGGSSDTQRLHESALTLLALQMTPSTLNGATSVNKLVSWLLQRQGLDGSWGGDAELTAVTILALSPVVTDSVVRNRAYSYLVNMQSGDGSWSGDPFLTALVLRAISFAPSTISPLLASLSGQVYDKTSGTALSGAVVTVIGATSASVLTTADGRFSVGNIPAGSINLQVTKPGYGNYSTSNTLNAGQSIDVGTVSLVPNTVSGIVRGQVTVASSATPIEGVTISLGGAAALTAVSDVNGRFEFSTVPPGAITLSASLTGYNPVLATGTVLAGQTLLFSPAIYAVGDPTAPTTGRFSGKVVGAGNGVPLAGVSIELNGKVAGTTGADGRFDLNLAPQAYNVRYLLTGFDVALQSFALTAGAVADAGVVALTPQLTTTTLHGVVTDQASGAPIAAAQVQILNGPSTITGVNGIYTLAGLEGTSFDLSINATGYQSQSWQFQASRPSDVTHNFALQLEVSSGIELAPLVVTPSTAASRADIGIATTVNNTGSAVVSGVLSLQVVDAKGNVVDTGAAYDPLGGNLVGVFALGAAKQLDVVFRWNTAQFPPGAYSLITRVSESGSVSRSIPLGNVLASRQGVLNITEEVHFNGSITADPPVLRAKTNTAVHLSGVLQNDGNTDLPAQNYQLQIIAEKTGVVVAAQQFAGDKTAPGALQNLVFADWTPVDGGNYRLEFQAVANSALGKIIGKLYVGDAATATYTTDKLVVPPGTQTVKGAIHVTGQDVTLGTISDPLAPLIKTAIQKGVTYNDAQASNWAISNRCLGCHVVSQALVGGELTRRLTTYDAGQRNTLLNGLTTYQQTNGAIYASHPEYSRTQTTLGTWALNSWHKKEEILTTLLRATNYLVGAQESSGRWTADHGTGGWDTPVANTAFNTKSLTEVYQQLSKAQAGSAVDYVRKPWVSGNGMSGTYYLASDSSNNVFVSNNTARTVSMVKPDGTLQTLMTGLSNNPHAIVVMGDGTLYVASQSGLLRRNSDGTSTTVTTRPGAGLALGPDGNLYMSDYWSNKIYQISPQGVLSDYVVGGPLSGPIGIAFSPVGDLLVANYTNLKVLRFKADKTYTVAVEWTNGNPRNIQAYGNDWLVGTNSGLFRYNSEWQGERLLFSATEGIAVTPNGRIVLGDGVSSLFTLEKTPVDVNAKLSSLNAAITNGTNWLLIDSNVNSNSNLDLAQRMIGLGSAHSYFAGTAMESTLLSKMKTVDATLRSRQSADGGWGRNAGGESDSLVTAQVGFALDYLDPSAQDPVIQKAIKWLLGRQQPDGSWYSENGVLGTHLAATTWVTIWLPIALDRLGGIDTDLTVVMPGNVDLSHPNIAPASTSPNSGGGITYSWKLQGVTAEGQDIKFDLSLRDLALNETRSVSSNAFLTFNNAFTQSPVSAQIGVPRVNASAFLDLGVTTDRMRYDANTPVNIFAVVANTGGTLSDGVVKLEVFAADNVLVADLGTQPFVGLAPGAQQTLGKVWNTGTSIAGSYYILATLYDLQNRQVGTAKSLFTIDSGIAGVNAGLGAAVTTDKQIYQPYDVVKISDRINNLAINQLQENLSAVTKVYKPDGSLLWSQKVLLGQLAVGALKDLLYTLPIANVPSGHYRVKLSVQDALFTDLAMAETAFEVASSAQTGSGLKGIITATPKRVPQGGSVLLTSNVTNLGNADINGLPFQVSVVDLENQQIVAEWKDISNLVMQQSYASSRSWLVSGAVGKTYVAILSVVVGGKIVTLGQDSFVVVEPPVKLEVNQQVRREGKVLVLLSCKNEEQDVGQSNLKENEQKGPKHDCLSERISFLDSYLTSIGLTHMITASNDAFLKAFRSGRYNVYWVSGGREKLKDELAEEVREAVFRGDGLILDGVHDERNKDLDEVAGILYRGKLSGLNRPVVVNGPLFTPQSLVSAGQALKVQLLDGTQQAIFSGAPKLNQADDALDHDDAGNIQSFSALVSNQYGQGRGFVAAFDMVGVLMTQTQVLAWSDLLRTGLGYITPELSTSFVTSGYLPMSTLVRNLAQAVNVEVQMQLPIGATVVASMPVAALDVAGQPLWQFNLPANNEQMLNLGLTLPKVSGSYQLKTNISVSRNGQTKPYGSYVLGFEVASFERLGAGVIGRLNVMTLKGADAAARDKAVIYLQAGINYAGQGNVEESIDKLLDAIEGLRKISSINTSSERLVIDRMLQSLAIRWDSANKTKMQ